MIAYHKAYIGYYRTYANVQKLLIYDNKKYIGQTLYDAKNYILNEIGDIKSILIDEIYFNEIYQIFDYIDNTEKYLDKNRNDITEVVKLNPHVLHDINLRKLLF